MKSGDFSVFPLCNFSTRDPKGCIKVKADYVKNFTTYDFTNSEYYYINVDLDETNPKVIITKEAFDELKPYEKKLYEKGIIRKLENEDRKKGFAESKRTNEIFIFCKDNEEDLEKPDLSKLISIHPKAIDNFHNLADSRTKADETLPFHPVGTRRNEGSNGEKVRIKAGDLIYFQTGNIEGKEFVTEISHSAIWRDLVGQENKVTKIRDADTTFDFFIKIDPRGELLPFNKDRNQITLAEQVFDLVRIMGKKKPRMKN